MMASSTTPVIPTLTTIPPEVRSEIFVHLFHLNAIPISFCQSWKKGIIFEYESAIDTQVLQTCHLLNDEGSSIFDSTVRRLLERRPLEVDCVRLTSRYETCGHANNYRGSNVFSSAPNIAKLLSFLGRYGAHVVELRVNGTTCFPAILLLMLNLKIVCMDYRTRFCIDSGPPDNKAHEQYLNSTYYDDVLKDSFDSYINGHDGPLIHGGPKRISQEWANIVDSERGKDRAFEVHGKAGYEVSGIGFLVSDVPSAFGFPFN